MRLPWMVQQHLLANLPNKFTLCNHQKISSLNWESGEFETAVSSLQSPASTSKGTQGRYGDDSSELLVDLSPYGAINRGVSRQHALLTMHENQTTLMDLNSATCSWINQEQADPAKTEGILPILSALLTHPPAHSAAGCCRIE